MSRTRAAVRVEKPASQSPRGSKRRPQSSEAAPRRSLHRLSSLRSGNAEAKDPEATLERALESGNRAGRAAAVEPEVAPAAPPEPRVPEPETATETATEAATGAGGGPAGEAPVPTFELPEMPATELAPEERAARQAELAEARATIEEATTAGGAVEAFAEAPPSVKAVAQASLGERVDRVTRGEEATFQEVLPEFHAEMGGTPLGEREGAPPVSAPPIGEVRLEEGTPEPDRQPELPPTGPLAFFRGNAFVVSLFDRLFDDRSEDESSRAEAIGSSLADVKTSDPEIETTPGPVPKVALEGETDPERVAGQKQAGREQARGARDEAARAVIEGPGPEQAQLLALDEVRPVGELKQPEVAGVAAAEGAARFQMLAMPEEVNARFDADLHASMRDSLGEARGAVESAETERDESRAEALAEAEAERQTLVERADSDQRAEVLAARRTIQTERQTTLEAQAEAVRELETEAEREDRRTRREIGREVESAEGQISRRYETTEAEARKEVRQGERDAEAERQKAEEASKKRSWWDRLKSWVKEQFAKLTAAIGKIFDAVRAAIKEALDAVRSFAKGLIDRVAGLIKSAIAAFGELLKGLVNTLLADLFPELARKLNEKIDRAVEAAQKKVDQIAEDLKAGVDALVDRLQAGLDAILDVFQAALNLGLGLLAAALTGDWGEVARLLLESALKVVGVDPKAFYAFVGRALDVLGRIIEAPGMFLGNCVEAVLQGIRGFAGNFLEYLKEGIVRWLTGALGDIEIPERFDLAGVLHLGRQILGLTWDWLRRKAVKLVGEKNVERLEFLASYVETLREGGWGALFDRVRDELAGLAGEILGKIKEFLVQKVILGAVSWIASLFTPVGAVVKLLFTVWNLFVFLRDQISRIAGIVKSVVDAIAQIAEGVLEAAAARVERALADVLPVAIDLVASLLGLKGVGRRVREVITGIRARFDRAVDRLLGAVLKRFRPKPKEEGAEAKAAEKAREPAEAGAAPATLGKELPIEVGDGERHALTIDLVGADAVPTVHSSPVRVTTWIQRWEKIKDDDAYKGKTFQSKTGPDYLAEATGALKRLDPNADALARKIRDGKPVTDDEKKEVQALEGVLHKSLLGLFKIYQGFGREGLTDAVLDELYGKYLDSVHPDARQNLRNLFRLFSGQWQRLKWEEIRIRLAARFDPFRSPLALTDYNQKPSVFGQMAQRAIADRIAANPGNYVDPPEEAELRTFFSAYLLRDVQGGEDKFAAALRLARDTVFSASGDYRTLAAGLDPAVHLSLKRMRSKAKKPTDEFLAALADTGGDIIKFLERMATGKKAGNIAADQFKEKVWDEPGNQELVKNRFRGADRGKHEWIPTDMIYEVIQQAAADRRAVPEEQEVGLRWVQFQHQLRSGTELLYFVPESDAAKKIGKVTAPYARDAADPEDEKKYDYSRKPVIMQGHSGAVYAPARAGDYAEDVVPQSTGQKAWHDQFRDAFRSIVTKDTTREQMRKILNVYSDLISRTVWDGKQTYGPEFQEYYLAAQKPPIDTSKRKRHDEVATVAASHKNLVRDDFDRARQAAGLTT